MYKLSSRLIFGLFLTIIGSLVDYGIINAQIIPDNSLGAESSRTRPDTIKNTPSDVIDGGATRGSNLFHSFREFNVNESRGAYFANPYVIQNIFSRVTGGNISQILGTLGVLGNANLFLINPSGIIFGPNARLDMRGAFIGATADSVVFDNNFEFSATNPNSPPLLTVNIPLGLRFRENAGNILAQGSSLEMQPGKTLTLAGGHITLEEVFIAAPEGRIDLGSITGESLVQLNPVEKGWTLGDEGIQNLGNILLSQGSFLDVSGEGGGNVQIQAARLDIIQGSYIFANTLGLGDGGEVLIRTTETVNLQDSSWIRADILGSGTETINNTGGIEIITGSLSVTNGSQIQALTFGQGNAGAITIVARDTITLDGTDSQGYSSGIFNNVATNAVGNTGGINITTSSLAITNGGVISASTFGEGNAGSVRLSALDTVSLNDENGESYIFNNVGSDAVGNTGGIEIITGSLFVTNGTQIQARTSGQGNAGAITIVARDTVTLDGTDNQGYSSGIFNDVEVGAVGNSGGINITTGSLLLTNGGQISASTFGEGNAGSVRISALDTVFLDDENGESYIFNNVGSDAIGNTGGIEIMTGSLFVTNGAQIQAQTSGQGDAGTLTVNASNLVELIGTSTDGQLPSGLFTKTQGAGDAGDLKISTGRLIVQDGANVNAEASLNSTGRSGNLTVTASDLVELIGGAETTPSTLSVDTLGTGKAGNLTIKTEQLIVRDGAQVSASTIGFGNAGNLTVHAAEVKVIGKIADGRFPSLITTQTGNFNFDVQTVGTGNAGNLIIETGQLIVRDGAQVSASTSNDGQSGTLTVFASDFIQVIDDGSTISVQVEEDATGFGGKLLVNTGRLIVRDGGQVIAGTFGRGRGGSLTVIASDFVEVSGTDGEIGENETPSGLFTATFGFGLADAGDLIIDTKRLVVRGGAQVSTATFGIDEGKGGNLRITASESVDVIGSSVGGQFVSSIVSETGRVLSIINSNSIVNGGNLTIKTGQLNVQDGAIISAQTFGAGNAGSILIDALKLNIAEEAAISAQTSAPGKGGNITVNAPSSVILGENSQLNVETSNAGQAGNIDITSNTVTIGKNAEISATATETATNTSGGGSITINASNLNLSGKLGIFAETQGQSPAGNLTLKPDGNQPNLNIQFTDTALISARTTNQGTGGSINISSPQIINIAGEGKITVETTGSGLAGNINMTTEQLNIGNQTEITASTTGTNNAGSINLNANQINLQGAIINAYTDGTGSAGSINLSYLGNNANSINLDNSTISTEIRENAQVNPNIEATPSNISLNADTITLTNNSRLSAKTEANLDAGTVNINSNTLNLSQNSQIETLTQSSANAGSITINANQQITITNANSGLFAQTSSGGLAGNITINTPQFTLAEGAKIQASTSSSGNGGSITINAPISLNLDENSQLNVETSNAGQAGNIEITSNTVTIGKDAQISATATRDASNTSGGGSININASNLNIAGKLGIFAETTGEAPAGTLTLNPDQANPNLNIRFIEQGLISASTSASGNGGDINIGAPNNIDISGNGTIAVETSGSGHAGTINFSTNQLNLASGIRITASTTGTGNAGDINLDANQINLQQATVTAFTNGGGNAGNINVPNAQTINLTNSTISTEIQAQGIATEASNITLTSNTLELDNSNITASTAGSGNAGEITLINQQLELNNSSVNATSTGVGDAGSISLPETQNLSLNQSQISVSTTRQGNAGSITVPTAQTINLNQSQITASTSGVGDTGTIELTGTEQIALTNNSQISNAVETGGMGNAQTITLNTPHLILDNSDIISSTDGTGNAGSITVPNAQTITLDNSTISTEIQAQGTATEASNITIQTQQLTLDNNSQITATTSGDGDAGTITITADSLRLTNRSSIQTNTASSGVAGDLVFNLSDDLTLDNSTLEASTSPNSTGNGGSIRIDPRTVTLNNNALISVNSQGTGDGGNLSLVSENLFLNERSSISATTASGEGGNITLNVKDTVTQRNNSPISATAGGTGNGGNITLNTRFLVGNENSNITANAFQGRGGNINITADGIFRGSNSPITASSQLGVDGVVDTNTPEVDPSRGLLNLPQNIIDPNTLIAQNACRRGGQSEFTVTGRGGLPNTPEQVQRSNEVEVGLVDATQQTATSKPKKKIMTTRKIIPAQGWQRNDKGEMVLVATPTNDNAHRTTTTTPNCSLN